ncbi:MAG: hypothetical protein AAF927_08545 [Bacteroidota bacterium]
MFSNQVLHFTTEEAYHGLAAVSGMMRLGKNQLILEYQVKDALVGMLKSEPKELVIPFENLVEVVYKLNWAVSRFKIQVNSMHILGKFPVGKEGVITLKIKRKQKQAAKELASSINLKLSEYRLEMMDHDDYLG